jgi:uncharacterized RDD family membrane protein YckC
MADEQAQLPTYLGRYAGFVTRLVAFAIDQVIVNSITFVTAYAVNWVINEFAINELLGFSEVLQQVQAILTVMILISVALLYYIGFWMLAGQTLGKRIMGVRIVRTDGGRVKFGNAVVRWLGYVVSGILFLGFLWILFDNKRQGFHDKLAGTFVVYSWPEDELKGTFVRDRVQRLQQRRLARNQKSS